MINLDNVFSNLGVISADSSSKDVYGFFKTVLWSDGTTTNNQYEFFKKADVSKYDFFKQFGSEFDFYSNIDDEAIFDYKTFYENAQKYLCNIDSVRKNVTYPIAKFPYLWYITQAYNAYKDETFKITESKPAIQFGAGGIIEFPYFVVNRSFKVKMNVELMHSSVVQTLLSPNDNVNGGLYKGKTGAVIANRIVISFGTGFLVSDIVLTEGWHNIEWEYNITNHYHYLYIDGVQSNFVNGSLQPITNVLNISGRVITAFGNSNFQFTGKLAELEIENYLHYKLTEGRGNFLYDCFGNNNGILQGIYTWSNVSAAWSEQRNLLNNNSLADSGFATGWGNIRLDKNGYLITANETNANGSAIVANDMVLSPTTYTISISAKAGSSNFLCLQPTNSAASTRARCWFNLSTGTIADTSTTAGFIIVSSNIENEGYGWYRCSFTFSLSSESTISVRYYIVDGQSSISVTQNKNLYVRNAQFEKGNLSPLQRYNNSLLSYDAGGYNFNLVNYANYEGYNVGYNLVLNSNNWTPILPTPDRTKWLRESLSITWVQNAGLAPDGTNTATRVGVGYGTGFDFYRRIGGLVAGQTYNVSFYVKLETATNLNVVLNNTIAFNTITGNKQYTSADGLNTTTWTRIVHTFTAPDIAIVHFHIGKTRETGMPTQSTGTVLLWGIQCKLGTDAGDYQPSFSVGNGTAYPALTSTSVNKEGLTITNEGVYSLTNTPIYRLLESSTHTTHRTLYSPITLIPNANIRFTAYVKQGTGNRDFYIGFTTSTVAKIFFNLSTLSITTSGSVYGNITDKGDGWFFVEAIYTTGSTGIKNIYVGLANSGSEVYPSDNTSSILVTDFEFFPYPDSYNIVGTVIPKREGSNLDVLGNQLTYLNGDCVSYGSDSDYSNVTSINVVNKSINTNLSSELLGKFKNLTNLDVSFNNIEVLDISQNPLLVTLKTEYNRLTNLQNSAILLLLDSFDLSNGYFSYSNFGGGSLTPEAITAVSSLNSKGWTIVG